MPSCTRGRDGGVESLDRGTRSSHVSHECQSSGVPLSTDVGPRLLISPSKWCLTGSCGYRTHDSKSVEVQGLWERFINAARAAVPSEIIAQSIDELREFLRSFNERYDTWNEEIQLDYLHRSELLRKTLLLPNISFIEAQIVMRYLTTQLGGMADAIREKKPFNTTHSIEAIYLFSVLTRVPDNRQVFSLDTVVETLVNVFKMILVGFQGLFSENVRMGSK